MKTKQTATGPKSEERRRFMEMTVKYGFTTAVVAAAAGTLVSGEAAAQTAQEEKERQKAAKHTMTLATPYAIGTSRSDPMMQLDFKENVQNMSKGAIYVKQTTTGKPSVRAVYRKRVE